MKRLFVWGVLLLEILPAMAHAEATVSVHEAGPLTVPATSEGCVLIVYPLPQGFLLETTPEAIRAFLVNNGISLQDGGFAVYLKQTGSLLVAASPSEHETFGAGLHGD